MKILLVVDRYAPEARSAAHLFEDLAVALTGRGHAVSVLTKKPTENLPGGPASVPDEEVRGEVAVSRLSSPLGEPRATFWKGADQALFAVRVLVRLLAEPRADAVLVYSPPLLLAGACALAARLGAAPLVVNLHDLYPRTAVELGRLRSPFLVAAAKALERFVYASAARIVVPAPGSMAYLTGEMGIAPEKVRLVYNWLDLDAVRPAPADGFREEHGLEGRFLVTYAGLVGVAQDLTAVVAAARAARDPSLVFLVVGEGSELSRWKAAADGLENLRFLPTLSRRDYLRCLRASDVGLIALSAELRSPAIPGKLQNLMALGLPVAAVVPEGSAAAQAVRESGCGAVTAPGDGAALLAAVESIRRDAGRRSAMGAGGRRFAEERFALAAACAAFERALGEAAK